MAEDKKGFILYADQQDLFDQLPNDKAGELIKHIFKYVNDEDPQTDDLIINLAFTPIKKQFKRDLEKWEKTREGRSKAGKASAESRRNKKEQTLTNSTNVKSVEENPTNSTVKETVNVTVNVKDKVTVIKDNIDSRKLKFANSLKVYIDKFGRETVKEFYEYWTENNKSNTKFKMELQKTWDSEKRLSRWSQNDFNNKNTKNGKGQTNFDAVKEWGQDFLDSQDKSV